MSMENGTWAEGMPTAVYDLLAQRYSCRGFSPKPVPPQVVRYIVECGRLAASGGNQQPWKFGVVTDRELIGQLAEASSVNFRQDWIATAPLIIALCVVQSTREDLVGQMNRNRFPTLAGRMDEADKALYTTLHMEEGQVKIPGTQMVLAALEHGVGCTWVSSMDCERIARLLGVEGYLVSNLLVFGYPETQRKPTPKKALDAVVFTNHFGNGGLEDPGQGEALDAP